VVLRSGLCVLFIGFVLPSSETLAQPVSDLAVGARVRVVAGAVSPRRLTGTIVRLDAASLEVQTTDRVQPMLVPREAITKIQISLGPRSRWRGAWIGALIGGAIAAVAALAALAAREEPCEPQPDQWFGCASFGPSKGAVLAIVGATAVGSGAAIGALLPPGERWKNVAATALPGASRGPARTHELEIGWAVRF
jgi:hypothetical protein